MGKMNNLSLELEELRKNTKEFDLCFTQNGKVRVSELYEGKDSYKQATDKMKEFVAAISNGEKVFKL